MKKLLSIIILASIASTPLMGMHDILPKSAAGAIILEATEHQKATLQDGRVVLTPMTSNNVEIWTADELGNLEQRELVLPNIKTFIGLKNDKIAGISKFTTRSFCIGIWDTASGKLEKVFVESTSSPILFITELENERIASVLYDATDTVKIWNLTTGYIEHVFIGHPIILTVGERMYNRRMPAGGLDITEKIWDIYLRAYLDELSKNNETLKICLNQR